MYRTGKRFLIFGLSFIESRKCLLCLSVFLVEQYTTLCTLITAFLSRSLCLFDLRFMTTSKNSCSKFSVWPTKDEYITGWNGLPASSVCLGQGSAQHIHFVTRKKNFRPTPQVAIRLQEVHIPEPFCQSIVPYIIKK